MVNIVVDIISIAAIAVICSSINQLLHRYKGAQDEIHYARTGDGYEVALYRYRPERITPGREPVIMCHGLGGNRYSWDPGPLPSFARYLKQNGFDVWLLDLRGRGLSSRPDRERGGRLKWGWTFDDYVKFDLPAAIAYVIKETKSEKVNWVGHSMGGMVMYAYLQTQDSALIKSATALGSPATFRHMGQWNPLVTFGPTALRRGRWLPVKPFGRLFSVLGYIAPTTYGTPRNLYPWFGVICVESPSAGVLMQFIDWMKNHTFHTVDHSYRYDENFEKITTPFMVISAAGDFIASPADVRYGVERMSSTDKEYVFFSKKSGALENYDHMSMLVSDSAVTEVYPVIRDWLQKHSG